MTKNTEQPNYSAKDPYLWYRWIQKSSPVLKIKENLWLITRYEDITMLLNDKRCTHWGMNNDIDLSNYPIEKSISQTLRALSPGNSPNFRKQIMHQLALKTLRFDEKSMQKYADNILLNLYSSCSIEFMRDYAHPFTFGTFCQLMGVYENDVQELSTIVSNLNDGYLHFIDENMQNDSSNEQGKLFIDFIKRLIKQKQRQPGNDICSAILDITIKDKHSESFIISLIILLFYAGHQNMMNFMGNSIIALYNKEQEQALLRNSLTFAIESVDELIRYDSPLQAILLITNEEINLNGHLIPAKSTLQLSVGAANRDPLKFDNPDKLILERRPSHLGFGAGAFRCIGARLAQIQGGVGLNRFFSHIKSFDTNVDNVNWKNYSVQRGPSDILLDINWNNE